MLEKLKKLIDEESYPYFDDTDLLERLEAEPDVYALARELCLIKSGIEEMRLGDIAVPSPRQHFLNLASRYRRNQGGVVKRADEY